MEKKYILQGLDCPNCAMKLEDALNKQKEIKQATVTYANLLCVIEYQEYSEEIENKIIKFIKGFEDGVTVIKKEKAHIHESVHEHHNHKHQHNHEAHEVDEHAHHHHHHSEECNCGHHHEEHQQRLSHEHHHDHKCCCEHDHHHLHHHHEGHAHEEHEHVERHVKGNYKWTIEGLDCAHCALKVEDAVNEVAGVKSATLNFTTKKLLFDLEENVNADEIKKNIKKAILDTEEVQIIEDILESKVQAEKKGLEKKHIMILTGIICLMIALISKFVPLYFISYVLIGYTVIRKSLKNIARKDFFDENFLMMIATIGALIVGEYTEASAVMLFYQIGEYFQDKAVAKSRKSIADLMDLKSDVAHKVMGNEIIDVDPESIQVNDIILVKPGERIPLDGEVLEGVAAIDTSALTGESIPQDIEKGSYVLAGCIDTNGLIYVKVLKSSSESTVARILDLVENASSKKAATEQKMTRFARVYTPIVVISALVLAIVPNFFHTGIPWNEWLMRACTFLVISCPCALVLSIPLGYFAGIGASSKKGVLIKGGSYLEILNEIDTIVFDKTGTLTTGKFKVQTIYAEDSQVCLEIAAHAESYSTHPVALSILEAYGNKTHAERIGEVEEIAGKGVHAYIDGKEVLAGNEKLMQMHGIEFEEIDTASTIVYVACDDKYLGAIEIADTVKPTVKPALADLKARGIKRLIMLSGDKAKRAEQVGNELGFNEVHAQLLPQEKVNEIEKIIQNKDNGKVAYVGDGINDAPVLARCDLGIAMGGLGSEAAIEASDIVLMNDDIQSLVKAVDIAKITQLIMNQNIGFILGVKILVLVLSLFGYADMWLGVFADVGVCLLAVLNAMRILQFNK